MEYIKALFNPALLQTDVADSVFTALLLQSHKEK